MGMIQLISVTNNFLKTHRIQSLTFLKNKIKSSETFQKSSNFSQKYLVKKKLSDDTSRLQNNSKFEVAFKGLAFWSSLFFIFFFLSNPSLSKINSVSNAVSANFSKIISSSSFRSNKCNRSTLFSQQFKWRTNRFNIFFKRGRFNDVKKYAKNASSTRG